MPVTHTRVMKVQRIASTQLSTPPNGVQAAAITNGDFVIYDVNGRPGPAVAVATTLDSTTGRIAVLNEGGQGATVLTLGALVTLEKLTEDTFMELTVTSTDAAIATPATTAPTLIGKQFALRRCTNGIYSVNQANTTNPLVEVVALGTTYPISDNFATVIVKFIAGKAA